jgi:hypothetical protein
MRTKKHFPVLLSLILCAVTFSVGVKAFTFDCTCGAPCCCAYGGDMTYPPGSYRGCWNIADKCQLPFAGCPDMIPCPCVNEFGQTVPCGPCSGPP